MKIIRSPKEMQNISKGYLNISIGFIPTMGFLHEGHKSLIAEAKRHHEIVVVSIFVNPLQFGPDEDLERYPRDEARDITLLEELNVDYAFIPTVEEMYPVEPRMKMQMIDRVAVLCGRSRTNHFDGVAMVVTKLLNIVKPTHIYFGLKDAQQFAVIQAIIEDLNIDVKMIGMPTIRESDGLAKSSRNVYLDEVERAEAIELSRSLKIGQRLLTNGEKNSEVIIQAVKEHINETTSAEIDYLEILTYPELLAVKKINEDIVIAGAVKFKKARLIDNLLLTADGNIKQWT